MLKARAIVKGIFLTSGSLTLLSFGIGILNIALSNGDVNNQGFGVSLVFRLFFILCALDVLAFLALLTLDIATRKASLWTYVLFAVLITVLLMLPVVLVGRT